jgi:hypothetical protein
MEILYTSEAVRQAIRAVLAKGSGRRVAIAGFVGAGAEAYLPSPRGIELYCWPAAPGTNPSAVRKLGQKLGVAVHFSKRLHMKLYWSTKQGAVITSANLSSNALGHGDLKEFGVRVAKGVVDIDRVIRSLNATKMTDASLAELEIASLKERAARRQSGGTSDRTSFAEWYTQHNKNHSWSLAPYDEYRIRESKRLREKASLRRGSHFHLLMNLASTKEVSVDDYLLCVEAPFKGRDISWMFVTHTAKVPRTDSAYDRRYPFQIGQEQRLGMYRRPPFEIDAKFRRAIAAATDELVNPKLAREFDLETIRKPSKALLAFLYKYYIST